MRKIICSKKPLKTKVLEVTKQELKDMSVNFPISISEFDKNFLLKFENDDIVGYISGDIEELNSKNKLDLWFINKNYFEKNYNIEKIIRE